MWIFNLRTIQLIVLYCIRLSRFFASVCITGVGLIGDEKKDWKVTIVRCNVSSEVYKHTHTCLLLSLPGLACLRHDQTGVSWDLKLYKQTSGSCGWADWSTLGRHMKLNLLVWQNTVQAGRQAGRLADTEAWLCSTNNVSQKWSLEIMFDTMKVVKLSSSYAICG